MRRARDDEAESIPSSPTAGWMRWSSMCPAEMHARGHVVEICLGTRTLQLEINTCPRERSEYSDRGFSLFFSTNTVATAVPNTPLCVCALPVQLAREKTAAKKLVADVGLEQAIQLVLEADKETAD